MAAKPIDLTGRHIGTFTVLERGEDASKPKNRIRWICLCTNCGRRSTIRSCHLLNDKASCVHCRSNKTYRGIGMLSKTRWTKLIDGACRRKIDVECTMDEAWQKYLIQNGRCMLSGVKMVMSPVASHVSTASLDRIDSSESYSYGNTQWVHKAVNIMKGSLSQYDYLCLCKRIAQHDVSTTERLVIHGDHMKERGVGVNYILRNVDSSFKCDLTEQTFGYWSVIGLDAELCNGTRWVCRCVCGEIKSVDAYSLTADHSKSCGCRNSGRGGISGRVWSKIRIGARKRGFALSISAEDAWLLYKAQFGQCALTGEPIYFDKHSHVALASLDRIDSTLGYVVGNIQWVDSRVNHMKWDYPLRTFVSWCKLVAEHSGHLIENHRMFTDYVPDSSKAILHSMSV